MNFQPEINHNQNNITGMNDVSIKINGIDFYSSLVLTPTGEPTTIEATSPHELTEHFWQSIIAKSPEVVLIGTGDKQQFLAPTQLAPLYKAHIGAECMSSIAAARTYNVLMSEGRKVVAILLLPKPTTI